MTLFEGFVFHGYRSFPSDRRAVLFPLRRMNLIAGQNNTGKSNILRVIADTYSDTAASPSAWDRPLGDAEHSFARMDLHRINDIITWSGQAGRQRADVQMELIRSFLRLPGIADPNFGPDVVLFGVAAHGVIDDEALKRKAREAGPSQVAQDLSRILTGTTGGDTGDDAYRVLRWITETRPPAPIAFTVGGVRTSPIKATRLPI